MAWARLLKAIKVISQHPAFAAMLMAGLDGIENTMDPGQPTDKDIYDVGPEDMTNASAFTSLLSAI